MELLQEHTCTCAPAHTQDMCSHTTTPAHVHTCTHADAQSHTCTCTHADTQSHTCICAHMLIITHLHMHTGAHMLILNHTPAHAHILILNHTPARAHEISMPTDGSERGGHSRQVCQGSAGQVGVARVCSASGRPRVPEFVQTSDSLGAASRGGAG